MRDVVKLLLRPVSVLSLGLSTMGIISFGLTLVAGKNRLPIPATGKTAFVIFFTANLPHTGLSKAVFGAG